MANESVHNKNSSCVCKHTDKQCTYLPNEFDRLRIPHERNGSLIILSVMGHSSTTVIVPLNKSVDWFKCGVFDCKIVLGVYRCLSSWYFQMGLTEINLQTLRFSWVS